MKIEGLSIAVFQAVHFGSGCVQKSSFRCHAAHDGIARCTARMELANADRIGHFVQSDFKAVEQNTCITLSTMLLLWMLLA